MMKISKWFPPIFFIVFGANFVSSSDIAENDEFWNNWVHPEEFNLFPSLPIAAPLSTNQKCREDSRALILNLKNKTLWASQMWDASATSAFGVLHGNKYQLGNFDECLAVTKPIQSQYCLLKVRAEVHLEEAFKGHPYDLDPLPNASVWKKVQDSRRDYFKNARDLSMTSLCVPNSCSASEIKEGTNLYLKSLNEKALKTNGTTYEVLELICSNNEIEPPTYGEIGFWVFSILLILIVVIASLLDFIAKKDIAIEKWFGYKLLMSFSLKRNFKKFTNVNDDSEDKYFRMLHGIKCVSAALIVVDHHALLSISSAIFNIQSFEEIVYFSFQKYLIPHGDLLVDTFFFISGFLVTYKMLSYTEKKNLNIFLVVFLRIIRLAPLYFYLIWFQASALHRFGSGPGWKYRLEEESEYCRKNYWANMLFIQNYVNFDEMCFIHAWYIPCDLHFLIIALILIMIIKKNEKVGVSIMYLLTVIAFVVPGIVTYIYKLDPLMLFSPEFLSKPRLDPSFAQLYVKSHTRAIVYLTAVITGYLLYKKKNSTWKITKLQSVLSCCFGLLLLYAPMAYGGTYFTFGKSYNLTESVIFSLLRRFSWGLGWVFIFFTMRFGTIPIIDKILGVKTFQILGKLVYGIYLIHFINQFSVASIAHIPKYFLSFYVGVYGLTDFVVATLYAGIMYLILEMPFKNFVGLLIFSSSPRGKDKENQQNNNGTLVVSTKPDPEAGRVYSIKL